MATCTNQVKNSATFLSFVKNTVSSFSNTTKKYTNQFLLMEDGEYLLLEDGGRIILEQSIVQSPGWNTLNKS